MHSRPIRFLTSALLLSCALAGAQSCAKAPEARKGPDSFQAITGNDLSEEREHWNRVFQSEEFVFGREPTPFLKENARYLTGKNALVIPMSEGKNAVYLAQNGFRVSGIDYSPAALEKAR